MIKFKEKQYTIEEGHYTGPKDYVPGYLEAAGSGALIGGGLGALVKGGKEIYEMAQGPSGRPEGSLLGEAYGGFKKGSSYGFAAGLASKVLLNVIHNPMKDVKFHEVDRNMRMRFGMFHAGGFLVGDTMDRRNKYDEKFATNDRDVTSYKINVAIQDGKVTMYLLGLSNEELKKVNKTLDYYCKKYQGMDYQSGVISASSKENSYWVNIIFTNYQVIGDFLSELSEVLMVKINLLDSKAIVENKLSTDTEKTFSVSLLDKHEILDILSSSGLKIIKNIGMMGFHDGLSYTIIQAIITTLQRSSALNDAILSKGKVKKSDLGNKYLETCMKECNFIEEIHYTVDHKNVPFNMYLYKGDLIVCVAKNDVSYKKFLKVYDSSKFFNKNEVNQVVVCTYPVKSRDELKVLLRKIISTGIVPNIFIV